MGNKPLTVDEMRERIIDDDVQTIIQWAIEGEYASIRSMLDDYSSVDDDTIAQIYYGRFE